MISWEDDHKISTRQNSPPEQLQDSIYYMKIKSDAKIQRRFFFNIRTLLYMLYKGTILYWIYVVIIRNQLILTNKGCLIKKKNSHYWHLLSYVIQTLKFVVYRIGICCLSKWNSFIGLSTINIDVVSAISAKMTW